MVSSTKSAGQTPSPANEGAPSTQTAAVLTAAAGPSAVVLAAERFHLAARAVGDIMEVVSVLPHADQEPPDPITTMVIQRVHQLASVALSALTDQGESVISMFARGYPSELYPYDQDWLASRAAVETSGEQEIEMPTITEAEFIARIEAVERDGVEKFKRLLVDLERRRTSSTVDGEVSQ